jgi:hypothetical protein
MGGTLFESTGSDDWTWTTDVLPTVGAALIHLPIKKTPKLKAVLAPA